MSDSEDYAVGYGKPPKHSRFKKGAPSPNPQGRPKAEASIRQALAECMSAPATVTTADGQKIQMPTATVIAKKITSQAASGSIPSQRMLLDIERAGRGARRDDPSKLEERVSLAERERANETARTIAILLHEGSVAHNSCFFEQVGEAAFEPTAIGRPVIDLHSKLKYGQVRNLSEYRALRESVLEQVRQAFDEVAFDSIARWDRGLKKSDLR